MQPSHPEVDTNLPISELVFAIWRRRFWIALLTGVTTSIGLVAAIVSPNVYQADAMIQIEMREGIRPNVGAISQMSDALALANPAEGEVGIIRSRQVVSNVVEGLGLDVAVQPLGVFKKKLLRKPLPELQVVNFVVPREMEGEPYELEILTDKGDFALRDGKKTEILRGTIGTPVDSSGSATGVGIEVVRQRNCTVGQKFALVKEDRLQASANINKNLSITEVGKKTGLMVLTLHGSDPILTSKALNAIADTYVEQSIQRRSREATKRVAYLEQQLPVLKEALLESEQRLSDFLLKVGSTDLQQESGALLRDRQDLEQQLLALRQRRKTELERFKPDHPSILTIDSNIALVSRQLSRREKSGSYLPHQQREYSRLQREVQSNSERYSEVLREAQQFRVVRDQQIGDARVVDYSLPSMEPVKPQRKKMLLMSIVAGIAAGCGLALLYRFLRGGLENPMVFEQVFERAIVAMVPRSNAQRRLDSKSRPKGRSRLLAIESPEDIALETLRSSVPSLRAILQSAPNRVMTISSPSPENGKSFVAPNLAALMALSGLKVVLIDGDLRRGRLHEVFDQSNSVGLADVLAGRVPVDQALQKTQVPGLVLMTSGTPVERSAELLHSDLLPTLFETLSNRVDAVIVEAPPVLALTDALVLGRLSGSMLVVLRHGAHSLGTLQATRRRLDLSECRTRGLILNDIDPQAPVFGEPLERRLFRYNTRS